MLGTRAGLAVESVGSAASVARMSQCEKRESLRVDGIRLHGLLACLLRVRLCACAWSMDMAAWRRRISTRSTTSDE
jgi:hypothetical protein